MQTGSGKTYTMLGEIDELEVKPSLDCGMTPHIFEFLMQKICCSLKAHSPSTDMIWRSGTLDPSFMNAREGEEDSLPHLVEKERLTCYKGFKEGHKRMLVATDLVRRGIDIEHVNIVLNYDMPDSADTYLHRVGRDGRFGTKRLAVTFISSNSDSKVLNQVQERFEVDIKKLPEHVDSSLYMSV
ncbi:hypothetical protein IFM89_028883 [Coptis chinensis]|uniref:Helicase C-terminal domain-containing protein n=1 Tax=Coptis chinensis TaxID=261450 RepID=A0A835H6M3_9MAGN|nr:hypothetical protein IFM89_028883 [Coptis chinensis]